MKDAQKPDHVSLNALINRLREGRFVIPDFQREFEWKPWDIRELMRSIFLDYFIGSLLLWRGKEENFKALSCEPIYGYNRNGSSEYIVLDGQQRLTALHYAFLAPDVPLPNRSRRAVYFMRVDKFMNEEYDEAFRYDWLSRRISKLLQSPDSQYVEHIFPLSVIGAGGWELANWVQGYERYWMKTKGAAEADNDSAAAQQAEINIANSNAFGTLLKDLTEEYQISYIELDKELGLDKVCDIFTQINSRGIRLDVFDLINALLVPKGIQLKHMWRQAQARLEFVDTEKMNVYILQVMSILLQSYCSPKYLYYLLPGQVKQVRDSNGTQRKETLIHDISKFQQCWEEAVDTLEHAIKLLRHPQEFGVTSSKYLPYVSILPVFAALQTYIKSCQPDLQFDAQRKIRHWYWASVFTNRYSGAVESTSARDFLDVRAWIESDLAEPVLIDEFKNRFRGVELRREVKGGTSVYNGVFNLLILQGARDWITGNIPQHDDLDDHHIVPRSWGANYLEGNLIHTILNRTPLSADTNRKIIGDKLPNSYLPELIKRNGQKSMNSILESHFISSAGLAILLRDPFTPADFEEFISERQRTVQDAIEQLLIKERLDLSANLRELDADVERVELTLRKAVSSVLESDVALLPPHVQQKVEERIKAATKRNVVLDLELYKTLDGKLEFCDIRELQDTIVSKKCWSKFQSHFINKESLSRKFSQLAELRNGIRHSRTVDEITKKEGEAALIWFKEILERFLN